MMTRLYCSDVVNSVDVLIIETSHGIVICILEYFAKFKTKRLFLYNHTNEGSAPEAEDMSASVNCKMTMFLSKMTIFVL